ncbi:uncharacterized protein LOC113360058 [Papaver somniferum]|uniref:uncharacterized protein LOC113360058 n=1 Tax=Papaver somniferum TaxID=3469 RepID=UPI000E6F4D6D|nr:uncharacterized protein LOC113360058 [Papaver somniferum]
MVQLNSVEEYFEDFEALKALMLAKNPSLSEHYFVMSFISGLKEELHNSVAMFYPKSLAQVFSLARMEERKSPATPKAYSPTPPKTPSANPIIKRLTQEQMHIHRDEGLCYNCDEVYSMGHKSKGDTIRIPGLRKKQSISILIHTGSTTSFLDCSLASKLKCKVKQTSHMLVTVANGEKTVSTSICSQLPWSMQGYQFTEDLRLLSLGGCDMVLGADWLKKLGDVVFNFSKRSVSFLHNGHQITLQGTITSPSLLMMSGTTVNFFLEKTTHGLIGHLFFVITSPIPPPVPTPLLPLLSEYHDIFVEPASLPPHRTLDHSIPLKPDSQPPTKGHIVKKKDNTWRFCVGYIKLNSITIKDKFHIPIVDELLDEMQGFMVLSKLDLRAGYHQILLNPINVYKTSFRTHHGHYEFKFMPFGLTNAPATFQSLMNEVFAPYLRKFALSQLEYLGHIITPDGVCADPNKIASMQSWPLPTSIKEVRGFLGLTAAISAFEKLKLAMSTTPVLEVKDFSKQSTVESDDSDTCLGVVLTQEAEILRYKSRLYVGASNGVRATILNTVHTSAVGGRSGMHATYARAKTHLFWHKMKKEILMFVAEYDICQRLKVKALFLLVYATTYST